MPDVSTEDLHLARRVDLHVRAVADWDDGMLEDRRGREGRSASARPCVRVDPLSGELRVASREWKPEGKRVNAMQ